MKLADRFQFLALTAGGLGLMKPASGTWGSTPPPAIYAIMVLAGASLANTITLLIILLLASCFACIAFTAWGEKRWGKKDAGQIVADEVAGQCLPLFIIPPIIDPLSQAGFLRLTIVLASAFFLFRFFDIAKLQPANAAQKLPHGWGVLVDDLIAGLYASGALWILIHFFW